MGWIVLVAVAAPLVAQTPPPVRIILVGDSTMAVRTGYGPGFCALATPQVSCVNLARGGRSSKSYRAEGLWDKVMETLRDQQDYKQTYVLIQFGHNDQPGKPGRSTDLATEFPANLKQYVEEVKSAGAQPVLVTPLTRRQFKNGVVDKGLRPWAEAAMQVAGEEHTRVLDLNAESSEAVQKMGGVEANTLAQAPPPADIAASAATGTSAPIPRAPAAAAAQTNGAAATLAANPAPAAANAAVERPRETPPQFDYTHVGTKGADYFGRMVARELMAAFPELKPYFKM